MNCSFVPLKVLTNIAGVREAGGKAEVGAYWRAIKHSDNYQPDKPHTRLRGKMCSLIRVSRQNYKHPNYYRFRPMVLKQIYLSTFVGPQTPRGAH